MLPLKQRSINIICCNAVKSYNASSKDFLSHIFKALGQSSLSKRETLLKFVS